MTTHTDGRAGRSTASPVRSTEPNHSIPSAGGQTGSRGWSAWKPVIVPAEHGGWGFLLEPVLLGWLVAPSWGALLLGLATIAGYLIRHPLKLVLVDRRRGLTTTRTRRARTVIASPAGAAVLCFLGALLRAGPAFLTPLALAVPFAAVYLFYDLTRPGRTLQAELTGPLALAFVASSMAVMGGWPLPSALVLWAALSLRAVPSVLYVRARIRMDRGRQSNVAWPILAHVLALIAVIGLAWTGAMPALGIVPYVLLLARAAWFLSPQRPAVQVKTIGLMELGLGLFLVLTLAIGYAL